MSYKLSPSDFKYLWEDCKYCYYQKVRNNIATPAGAFPAIFGRMNKLLQDSVMGKNLQNIHPDLPSGIVDFQEGFLKSKPVTGAEDCYISGRFDVLIRLDDGTYTVIDFKITKPDEEQIKKFSNQLHAYKYALENPDNGKDSRKISKMGLISVSPDAIDYVNGNFVFTCGPKWHPIKEDMGSFFNLVHDISKVLNGPAPSPSLTCAYCKYRKNFESIEVSQASML